MLLDWVGFGWPGLVWSGLVGPGRAWSGSVAIAKEGCVTLPNSQRCRCRWLCPSAALRSGCSMLLGAARGASHVDAQGVCCVGQRRGEWVAASVLQRKPAQASARLPPTARAPPVRRTLRSRMCIAPASQAFRDRMESVHLGLPFPGPSLLSLSDHHLHLQHPLHFLPASWPPPRLLLRRWLLRARTAATCTWLSPPLRPLRPRRQRRQQTQPTRPP